MPVLTIKSCPISIPKKDLLIVFYFIMEINISLLMDIVKMFLKNEKGKLNQNIYFKKLHLIKKRQYF